MEDVANPESVKVHAVAAHGLGRREMAGVYQECRCVLVKAGELQSWLREKTGSSNALLSIDPSALLGYMLLHEIGHLVAKHVPIEGSAAAAAPVTQFNRDPTAQKEREQQADRYAAGVLSAAASEMGTARGLAAAKVGLTLSMLSWNLAAHRLLDDFGATAVRKPALFWDAGYSHPNLELRILTVNAMVDGSETAIQLLKDFQGIREDAPLIPYREGGLSSAGGTR